MVLGSSVATVVTVAAMLRSGSRGGALFLVVALVLGFPLHTACASGQDRPNIVLVFMDNFGWGELGSYGGGILRGAPTPRLDELADETARWGREGVG